MSGVDKYRKFADGVPRRNIFGVEDVEGCVALADAAIAELEAEMSAPWHVGAFIDVDGFKVGPHMVRQYRERIAELEQLLEHKCDDCLPKYGAYQERAEQAEADRDRYFNVLCRVQVELAALKGRRCETCRHIVNCYVFDRAVNHTNPYFGTFACNRWAERGKP